MQAFSEKPFEFSTEFKQRNQDINDSKSVEEEADLIGKRSFISFVRDTENTFSIFLEELPKNLRNQLYIFIIQHWVNVISEKTDNIKEGKYL